MNPIVTFKIACNAVITFKKSPKDQFTAFARKKVGN